jgi:hypothetical protein
MASTEFNRRGFKNRHIRQLLKLQTFHGLQYMYVQNTNFIKCDYLQGGQIDRPSFTQLTDTLAA